MPLNAHWRSRPPLARQLDLPPPFRAIALREAGDAFAHAMRVAAEAGAGALVHVGRFDVAEFAVVLEPDEPLRTARRAIYAGTAALADALAAHAPPEKPISIDWPDAIRVDGGLVGGTRLAGPAGSDEETVPPRLVFGAMIRIANVGVNEIGLAPLSTALEDEGFAFDDRALVESFARHFMTAIDIWQHDGFGAIAQSYLARLTPESGVGRDIDDNGDLLLRHPANTAVERRRLDPALLRPSWLDPATGGPR
ncbi:MAG TPA: biotin/lipoate--protein ligase family protein [Xanthobacteraceae bacterium]|nr:biotin/lipoate--protein ligase family protein [Xanthobacteraceae bacterium]